MYYIFFSIFLCLIHKSILALTLNKISFIRDMVNDRRYISQLQVNFEQNAYLNTHTLNN